jgi:hypothetical protein
LGDVDVDRKDNIKVDVGSKDNIKLELGGFGSYDMKWIHLTQDRDLRLAFVNEVIILLAP